MRISAGFLTLLALSACGRDEPTNAVPLDSAGDPVVLVPNTAPTTPQVSLSPVSPTSSDDLLVSIDVPSTDAEEDVIDYSYVWTDDSGSEHFSVSPVLPGTLTEKGQTWSVAVFANDGQDSSVPATASVTIGNGLPHIASVTISPSGATANDLITCQANGVIDPDGDPVSVSYEWTVDGNALGLTGSELTGVSLTQGAQVSCSATPNDGTGVGVAVSSSLLLIANTAPEVSSASVYPQNPSVGQPVECVPGPSFDADGDPLSLIYGWSLNGDDLGVSGSTLSAGYLSVGDAVICSVTANDGSDTSAAVYSSAVYVSNHLPVLTGLTLIPAQPTTASTIQCLAGPAYDLDNEQVTLRVDWTINGALSSDHSDTLLANTLVVGDTVSCSITPSDPNESGVPVYSAPIIVANTAPSLVDVGLTPLQPVAGQDLHCAPGSATDAESDPISFQYAWSIGGRPLGSTGEVLNAAYVHRGDSVVCSVRPMDGLDLGEWVVSNVVEVLNTAPVISSVSLIPDAPTGRDSVQCFAVGSDRDQDPLHFTYGWTVNNVALNLGENTSTLSAFYINRDDTLSCTATPSDGTTSGASMSAATVTVANTPPVPQTLEVSPSRPTTDDILSVRVSWSDPDGDLVTSSYEWFVNSQTVAETGPYLDGSVYFTRGDTVYAVVTPNDGSPGTPVKTAPLLVANTAPGAPSAVLSPAIPDELKAIQCLISVGSWDADADPVTYRFDWTVNGVAYTGPFATTDFADDTIPVGTTGAGELWSCRATANDGSADGASSVDAVEIQSATFSGSLLIDTSASIQINQWVGTPGQRWRLCYRRSDHGASSATFHANCDAQGPTITVAQLDTGVLMGAYNSASWSSASVYESTAGKFLFSLTNNYKHAWNGSYGTYNNSSYGPTFGGGHDWTVDLNMTTGYCNLGISYTCRVGTVNTTQCQNDLCGSYNGWNIQELEVWSKN